MAKLKTVLPTELTKELEDQRIEAKASMVPELAALPARRRRLVLALLTNPTTSWKDALAKAGYSTKSHSQPAALKKSIQGALSETLQVAGIYEMDIARVLLRALDATNYEKVPRETFDGKGKLIERKTEMIPVPDYRIQLAAVKILAQLGGYFAANKVELSGTVKHEAIFKNVDPEVLEIRIRELEKNGVKAEFEVVDEDSF